MKGMFIYVRCDFMNAHFGQQIPQDIQQMKFNHHLN